MWQRDDMCDRDVARYCGGVPREQQRPWGARGAEMLCAIDVVADVVHCRLHFSADGNPVQATTRVDRDEFGGKIAQ
jgi:hypothetical protein